jgi:serine/threonine protein phosphatase 1
MPMRFVTRPVQFIDRMTERIIAIGDVHGCSAALAALVRAIDPTELDTLVFLGDYIDRGPDSRGVLEQVIALAERCMVVPLLGNHEELLLSAVRLALEAGCIATPEEAIPTHHLAFLQSCRSFYETETHLFVHANYLADLPLAEQPNHVLRWKHLDETTPRPHVSGKVAVVGHTPQRSGEILDLGYLKCIDTHCHGGGWLTALEVGTGKVWQADMAGELRK